MTEKTKTKSAAVDRAKELRSRDQVITLSTGIRARFVPVAASLLDDVTAAIVDPPIPTQFIEDKQREEANPFDPEYQRAVKANETERMRASLDVLVMFGVELADGIPDDSEWMPKLRFLEKRGRLDLAQYDLKDELEREFLFKRYIAVSSDDLIEIMRYSGITEVDIANAAKSFRSEKER